MAMTVPEICDDIEPLLKSRLFHPTALTRLQLDTAVGRFMKACSADSSLGPVEHINAALPELGVSNTAFWGDGERPLGPLWALNASVGMFLDGQQEVFLFKNVVPGGIAANAGIRAGDLLAAINHQTVHKMPEFRLGESYVLSIVDRDNKRKDVPVSLPNTPHKDRPPMAEPPAFSSTIIGSGMGFIRVSAFPGIIGFDFARQLSATIRNLQQAKCSRFIIDLRCNHGGGLGSLRLMSFLTPKKLPIGYSLSRAARDANKPPNTLPVIDHIPRTKLGLTLMALKFRLFHKDRSLRLITEGIPNPLRQNIAILVDESTRGGAENVASFAQNNQLAIIIGSSTPGENLGAANFRVAQTYHLRIPLVGWFLPNGDLGKGLVPDHSVTPTLAGLRSGKDEVLERAVELVQ